MADGRMPSRDRRSRVGHRRCDGRPPHPQRRWGRGRQGGIVLPLRGLLLAAAEVPAEPSRDAAEEDEEHQCRDHRGAARDGRRRAGAALRLDQAEHGDAEGGGPRRPGSIGSSCHRARKRSGIRPMTLPTRPPTKTGPKRSASSTTGNDAAVHRGGLAHRDPEKPGDHRDAEAGDGARGRRCDPARAGRGCLGRRARRSRRRGSRARRS